MVDSYLRSINPSLPPHTLMRARKSFRFQNLTRMDARVFDAGLFAQRTARFIAPTWANGALKCRIDSCEILQRSIDYGNRHWQICFLWISRFLTWNTQSLSLSLYTVSIILSIIIDYRLFKILSTKIIEN